MTLRLALGAAVAVGAALIFQLGRQNSELRTRYDAIREQVTVAKPGYSVPTFQTTTLDGDPIEIGRTDPGGHQLAFVFTAECAFCQATVPAWNRIVRHLESTASEGLAAVALSQSSAPDTRDFVADYGLESTVSLFPEEKLIRLFRAGSVPLIVLLDATGRVRYSRLGVLPAGPSTAIDSVLAAVAAELIASEEDAPEPVPGGDVAAEAPYPES